jgi:hypothetical protein
MAKRAHRRLLLSAIFTTLACLGVVLWIACAPLTTRTTALTTAGTAPEFALPTQEGSVVRLSEMRKAGPVVVVFYRGHW